MDDTKLMPSPVPDHETGELTLVKVEAQEGGVPDSFCVATW
jgi:hypothetical protein